MPRVGPFAEMSRRPNSIRCRHSSSLGPLIYQASRMETRILRPRRGTESHGIAETYRATCSEGHRTDVALDELREFLESDACRVHEDDSECGASLVELEPKEIMLQCQFCDHRDIFHWQEIEFSCDQCPGGPIDDAMQISGAYSTRAAMATDLYEFEIEAGWRKARPDHWECVTHFTKADSFAQILRQGRINASQTGYFRLPAICFTEVPMAWSREFKGRFGQFGFVIFKDALLSAGGAPAINLPENLISRDIPDQLRPFVNKIGSNFNFLHEREWRTPTDLHLATLRPMLVLPESPMESVGAYLAPEELARACQDFGVIQFE